MKTTNTTPATTTANITRIIGMANNSFIDTPESIIKDIIQTMVMNKKAVAISNVSINGDIINYNTLYCTANQKGAISTQEVVDMIDEYLIIKAQQKEQAMSQFNIDNIMAYGAKSQINKLKSLLEH